MNPRKTLTRKVVYMVLIAALLLPLFWLSQPPSPPRRGGKGSPGGLLSQMREKYGLAQTQLGQIDPASETAKWATFGMRGVAVNILWKKAETYKIKKDWTNYSATLNQLTKLAPNFVKVWIYQGWNYSYNISHEFDDYRDRYRYVIKGIRFLEEGIRHNQREPALVWEVGFYLSNKLGKADEWRQYRKLFKEDDDFNGSRPVAERDNWLVAKPWFLKIQELVDSGARMAKSPTLYRSDAPKCQYFYAETLEKEGTFGEVSLKNWAQAAREWNEYGNFDLPHTTGLMIRLNDAELHEANAVKLAKELDALAPGVREKIAEEKRKALPANLRAAIDLAEDARSDDQKRLAKEAEAFLEVAPKEVAGRVKGENRKKAQQIVERIAEEREYVRCINQDRGIVNFLYWRLRAEVEQMPEMAKARELIFNGQQAFASAQSVAAVKFYEDAFKNYRIVFDRYPAFKEDLVVFNDLMEEIGTYKRDVLRAVDKPFPKDFILKDLVEEYRKRNPQGSGNAEADEALKTQEGK